MSLPLSCSSANQVHSVRPQESHDCPALLPELFCVIAMRFDTSGSVCMSADVSWLQRN